MNAELIKEPLIFLIEDDLDDQYMFKSVMMNAGLNFSLKCFENGFLAYQTLTNIVNKEHDEKYERLPDLILLDLNLPVWDGKKTLTVLKKDQRFKHIPIVIYSTSKAGHDVEECYALGANSFISKASEYEILEEQIKTIYTYWFQTVLH